MEIISIGFLIVAVIGMIFFMAGVIYSDRHNNKQLGYDTDMRIYVPSRDRHRISDNGCDKRMEAEEVINGLQTIRMAASRQEKEYIDYACECVDIREKIFDKLIENMKGEKNEERKDSDT